MENKLEKYTIKKENLDSAYYFQSLLQEARRLELVSDSEFESIQMQSLQLLAGQTERFTGGKSSSVQIETAQGLMQSILYSIGLYLKSFPDADLGLTALKQSSLSDLYQNGKKLIKSKLDHAGQLFSAIQNNSIATDNCAYNDTLEHGVPFFFSNYDLEFAAHETPAMIDYPVNNDRTELAGVEYIDSYLQILFWENQFCQNFTKHDIHCLLRGYNDNYQDLLINIFGLVVTNALASVLTGKKTVELNIGPSDRRYLQQKLAYQSKEMLTLVLQDASGQLCEILHITEMFLRKHIFVTAMHLAAGLKEALKHNRLESIFIGLKEERTQPFFQYLDGEKMRDELFRSIADEIRACRYVSDKIAIIHREINSIADLADILGGYCLFGNEFNELFATLGDPELALLLKMLPTHPVDPDLHLTENEKEWHSKLKSFLNEITPSRKESIKKLAGRIVQG